MCGTFMPLYEFRFSVFEGVRANGSPCPCLWSPMGRGHTSLTPLPLGREN